ncbi:MAG: 1,4-alpha-glucan branching enzyme, partial [Clostridia bacterium]
MAKMKDSYATYLFHEGTNYQAYKLLSPSPGCENGVEGWHFSVWAPSAKSVSVVGDFNKWMANANIMLPSDEGIWTLFIAGVKQFDNYKYA